MRIKCECGGDEFEVEVPATVSIFVSASGERHRGVVGEVQRIEGYDPALMTYTCVQCGSEANLVYE